MVLDLHMVQRGFVVVDWFSWVGFLFVFAFLILLVCVFKTTGF